MTDYENFKEAHNLPDLSRTDYSKLVLIKAIFKDFEDDDFLTAFVHNGEDEIHKAYRAACEAVEIFKRQREIDAEIERLRKEYSKTDFRREALEGIYGETRL
jgi:hypothetical protein